MGAVMDVDTGDGFVPDVVEEVASSQEDAVMVQASVGRKDSAMSDLSIDVDPDAWPSVGKLVEVHGGIERLTGRWGYVRRVRLQEGGKTAVIEFDAGVETAVLVSFLRPVSEEHALCASSTAAWLMEACCGSALVSQLHAEVQERWRAGADPDVHVPVSDASRILAQAMVRHIAAVQVLVRERHEHDVDMSCQESPLPSDQLLTALLAQILPLIAGALPKDAGGAAVVPHPHPLQRIWLNNQNSIIGISAFGRPVYGTSKVCDQCNTRITDQSYYTCSEKCDFDFCCACHDKLEQIFSTTSQQHMNWVVEATSQVASILCSFRTAERDLLVKRLARDWPLSMFDQLVRGVVDVANSMVVHVEDAKNIRKYTGFWSCVAFLQILYQANMLDATEPRLDEPGVRGPRLPLEAFIMEGVEKCDADREVTRWLPEADVQALMRADTLNFSDEFCSFLTHAALVPNTFKRRCLTIDALSKEFKEQKEIHHLRVVVNRDAAGLRQDILSAIDGLEDRAHVCRPFAATFVNEDGVGPGVTVEFFQLGVRAFLEDANVWSFDEQHRCYWFCERKSEESSASSALFACGVLVAQGVLCNVLVPRVFPRVLYSLLLRDLNSVQYEAPTVGELATVDPDLARTLEQVRTYEGDDIGEVFGDLEWPGTSESVTHDNKEQLVSKYIEWFFSDRVAKQFKPFSDGFRAVLGKSLLLRRVFDASQLEAVVCGADEPVDVPAIRAAAVEDGWREDDASFLDRFWEAVTAFSEEDRRRFLLFATASDRMPLRGWSAIQLVVRRNGSGDDRLPTAYTCFNTLLLPRYYSQERLRAGLRQAILNSQGFGLA